MYEIRFHGRGGQGSVMGAEMFAKALLREGKYAVTIPAFGFERRGAPVQSFLKYDDKVIRQHTNVRYPDCVICIDPTVPNSIPIYDGIKENGVVILCTKKPLDEIKLHPNVKKGGIMRCRNHRPGSYRPTAADYEYNHVGSGCKSAWRSHAREPE